MKIKIGTKTKMKTKIQENLKALASAETTAAATTSLEDKFESMGEACYKAENRIETRILKNGNAIEKYLSKLGKDEKEEGFSKLNSIVTEALDASMEADLENWRLFTIFEIARHTHGRISNAASYNAEPEIASDSYMEEIEEAIQEADDNKIAISKLTTYFKNESKRQKARIKYFDAAEKTLNSTIKKIISGTPS